MKTTHHPRLVVAVGGFIVWLLLVRPAQPAFGFQLNEVISVGAAYTTQLVLHEMGHQVVAQDTGAVGSRMHFLSNKGGQFYLFDIALKSYRENPTTYNKALLFFSGADFLAYTLLANYLHPNASMHDPNVVREETGCSKEVLLSLVLSKTLLNAYRVANPEVNFAPEIWVDDRSAALLLRFPF
jgi:hypothetical protein